MKTRFGRDDLEHFTPNVINVPKREIMMCLNESPYNPFDELGEKISAELGKLSVNRYFSNLSDVLLELLAEYIGVPQQYLLLGNGADELLYYFFISNRQNQKSALLMPSPSYFDYQTYSRAIGMKQEITHLLPDFSINTNEYIEKLKKNHVLCAVLCNPNNPTGNLIPTETIEKILSSTNKPVLIDEAYYEFSKVTVLDLLKKHKNLLILRTFSKGFLAAGLRFGYLVGNPETLYEIRKVTTAFNLSLVTQAIAKVFLENQEYFQRIISELIENRKFLFDEFNDIPQIKAFESNTNFITFRVSSSMNELFEFLMSKEIAIRNVSSHALLKNCLRVTIGTRKQCELFLSTLKVFFAESKD